MNSGWRERAVLLIDEIVRGANTARLSVAYIARSVGVNRSTVWRDRVISEKIKKYCVDMRGAEKRSGKPRRRHRSEALRALRAENEALKLRIEMLYQNFIEVTRRLEEIGVDPFTVLGRFCPRADGDLWRAVVLPWSDQ